MTRCYWSDSKGEWWNSKTSYTSLLPCNVAPNNRLRQRCVILYKTSLLAHACHGLADIFSVRRDWVLKTHLHRMRIIPTKVNENCACIQERRDPFVYNKREFFSRMYNYLDWILAFKRIVSSFPQRYLVFPPCRRPLTNTWGGKNTHATVERTEWFAKK